MERDYKLLLIIGVITLSMISLVYAAHTATSPNGATETLFSLNESVMGLFNITINNTDAGQSANITQVNITFSSSNLIVNGSNGTNTPYSSVTNSSKHFSWINSTAYLINGSVNNSYFWFYASSQIPGTYNLTITYLNGTTAAPIITSTNLTVTINDTTSPNVSVTYPAEGGNYSLTSINFNLTVLDNYNLTPNGVCWYTLNNFTTNNTLTNTTTAPTVFNATNTSIGEGNHVAKFWCNDSANNVNNTKNVSFTIDRTAPEVGYSCAQSVVSHGASLTCTCSASDSGSGVQTTSSTSPNTQEYGTQTISCSATDYAGNSNSDSATFHVITGGGGTSSGAGAQGYDNTFVEDSKELSELGKITKSLAVKNRIRIKVNSETHNVGVRALTNTTATIEVSSMPQEIVFNIGDENKFDVTENGYYDLKVKLNSIESGKADITILPINERVPEEKDTIEETIEQIKQGKSNVLLIIGIILIVIVAGYFIFRKKK